MRFAVWLGIPKPMIHYPLLGKGAMRTVGSHLGRIPNRSQVPDKKVLGLGLRRPPPPSSGGDGWMDGWEAFPGSHPEDRGSWL